MPTRLLSHLCILYSIWDFTSSKETCTISIVLVNLSGEESVVFTEILLFRDCLFQPPLQLSDLLLLLVYLHNTHTHQHHTQMYHHYMHTSVKCIYTYMGIFNMWMVYVCMHTVYMYVIHEQLQRSLPQLNPNVLTSCHNKIMYNVRRY